MREKQLAKNRIPSAKKPFRSPAPRRPRWESGNKGPKFRFSGGRTPVGRFQFGARRNSPRSAPFQRPREAWNRFKKKNQRFSRPRYENPAMIKELFLKNFSFKTYRLFKRSVGPDKKLFMTNYWSAFKGSVEPKFSFTFSQADNKFYLGVVRSYMRTIRYFIKKFLINLKSRIYRRKISARVLLRIYYRIYKVSTFIRHLAKIYEKPFKKPDYYFKGYRAVMRTSFLRYIAIFCMKIFILSNRIYAGGALRIVNYSSFFHLWKKVYKIWLNTHYEKFRSSRPVQRAYIQTFRAYKLIKSSVRTRNTQFWRNLFFFRRDRAGYKRTLRKYLFGYTETNYDIFWPFGFRRKKYRFKYDIFGKRIYLIRKPLFRRKSRKYIRWFRSLVTGAYYFSPTYAEKTYFKGGFGRRAWFSRRRARHVFKMKFVFIRYFSKRFGLKNRTDFLRKAQHIARKRGNKWMRYYKEFESRLLRVLVLFGLSADDYMAKNFISSNCVMINKRIQNDHDHKFIPRVKRGDTVSLTNSAAPSFLKKKFKFFKKRLNFFERTEEAKVIYSFFKKHFSEWMMPTLYFIDGSTIRHGLSALMSGPVVTNSKVYFSINKLVPFFNRTLFKIFVQRFSKKLN